MSIKSFDEYFEGYKNYDDGGKLDQVIIADAKKVFETLKTPEAIEQFHKADYETQQKMVKGLDEGHSGFSFASVCSVAYKYASYKATETPYTFDEYFAGYKNYDDGGKLDQVIIADAKKVYETLKTPEAINKFYKASFEKQQEMVKGLDDGHSGFSFSCVCNNAYKYATYAQKYVKENTTQENTQKQKDTQITKDDLIKALDGVKYDKSVVLDMMDKHPDMVKTLVDAKDKEGKPLFDALAIDDVLFNCKDTIERKPDVITATLDDPKAIDWIADWENRGAALWRLSGDPLSSTIEKNPQAFGIQPKDEEIVKENNAGNANDTKLAHLKKLIESRRMTKDIKQGMDKSTPIKQVDANAPFNVVATKTSKTSER
ncbi:MAG: hypothetical protein IJ099_06700 [Alphaproteobacteria bacterium]|nr:hypothetical protein [Alphaproteobacteria bacterium]